MAALKSCGLKDTEGCPYRSCCADSNILLPLAIVVQIYTFQGKERVQKSPRTPAPKRNVYKIMILVEG